MCAYMMVGHTNKVKNGKMDVTTTVSVMTAWQENTHVQKGKLIWSNNIIPVPQHKLVKLSQFWRGFTHTYKSRTLENSTKWIITHLGLVSSITLHFIHITFVSTGVLHSHWCHQSANYREILMTFVVSYLYVTTTRRHPPSPTFCHLHPVYQPCHLVSTFVLFPRINDLMIHCVVKIRLCTNIPLTNEIKGGIL